MAKNQDIDDFPVNMSIPMEDETKQDDVFPKVVKLRKDGKPRKIRSKDSYAKGPRKKPQYHTEEGSPEEVGFDLLDDKAEFTDVISTNSIIYVFDCIGILFGDHWKVTPKQAKEIYTAFARAAEKLPKKQTARFKKYFDNYTPFIQLVVTLGAILYPKYEIHKLINATQNASEPINVAVEEFNQRNSVPETYQGFDNGQTGNPNARNGSTDGVTGFTGSRFEEYRNGQVNGSD